MKKVAFILVVVLCSLSFGNEAKAQVLDGIYPESHVGNKRPIPYQFLREADVMWSRTIWRKIDLRQKMNHLMYFPTSPRGKYKSLIDLLMHGIKTGQLTAFDESTVDEFATEMTISEIEERFGAKDEIIQAEDPVTGEIKTETIAGTVNTSDVKYYLVKELWFFDKQRSVLEVRYLGLCPVRQYFREEDIDQTDAKQKKLFWIYYPEARRLFAKNPVFNPQNDSERMSFDDLFNRRYFNSYIIQESNTFDNREISAYAIGVEALLESERIKRYIFDFEQDLWEY